MTIKFGTSGWRGLIAKDFTFPNLRICVQAIAEEIFRQKDHNKPFIVGYDTRFLSEHFAKEAAHILANNGLEVLFSDRDVPTPVVAHQIIQSQAAGGINITASHNPWNYNGLKLSTSWGGPALVETTQSIEAICERLQESGNGIKTKPANPDLVEKLIQKCDFRIPYLKHIKNLLDLKAFKSRRLNVVVDNMWGTAHGYLADLLRDAGCEVEVLHDKRDVLFGGGGPDPSTAGLKDLVANVKKSEAHLGLATDGDGDRFGVVDSDGTIYSANEILALLARYLVETRGMRGILAKSVMTTHAIDAVAKRFGLDLKETQVGFKYIGEIMKNSDSIMPALDGEFVMGGEESGGFSMRGHVPEKDGILACLLVAEMTALAKVTIGELLQKFERDLGVFKSARINIMATPDIVNNLRDRFEHHPPVEIDGLHVHRIVDTDGYKFIFHGGGWLGVRFSGTEPVVRLYLEADSEKRLEVLSRAGHALIYKSPSARKKRPTALLSL